MRQWSSFFLEYGAQLMDGPVFLITRANVQMGTHSVPHQANVVKEQAVAVLLPRNGAMKRGAEMTLSLIHI